MKAFYIKITDKPNIIKRIINFIDINNNEIIIQPIKKKKQIVKIVKKINKICNKHNVKNIVLSQKLKADDVFMEEISKINIHIFDGKWLITYMVYEVMEYVTQKINQKKEKMEVAILTKDVSNQVVETIKLLAKDYKRVGIITNNIYKFKYLERKIYNEYGAMITITNNKRKSLEKATAIINFDFPEDVLNQYNIFENAFIVNLQNGARIKKKQFKGTSVNEYEVSSTRADDYFEIRKLRCFDLKDLLEAHLYRKDSFTNIRQDIYKGHYVIKELS